MYVIAENTSLKTMNDTLSSYILKYEIIGDLPLSLEDFQYLSTTLQNTLFKNEIKRSTLMLFQESIATFLVFCAVYEYDNRTFWKSVENYTGELSQPDRMKLFNVFQDVLKKYNLNLFENEGEEGYTYVTPILCHAGIPINAFDTFFLAMSNTLNDTFYDDFDVQDYIAYLKYRTEVVIGRYLKLTGKKDAYLFLQNTKELLLKDSIESDESFDSGNYLRMTEQLVSWKEKPKNKKGLQARKNVQLTAPKIKLDLDGAGLYIELPRILVKDCYDAYLVWEIESGESNQVIKADYFKRGNMYVTEEKIVTLKPAETYSILLKVDDNQISQWTFEMRNDYIAFNPNGNLIKNDILPNSTVILLVNKDESLIHQNQFSITELPSVPYWSAYDVYKLDLSNVNTIQFTNFDVAVRNEEKMTLAGGKYLFDQDTSKTYMILPYIIVPKNKESDWYIEIKKKANGNILSKTSEKIIVFNSQIHLNTYIEVNNYGEYEIKVWNKSGINGRFSLEYVPFGKIQIDEEKYWPSNMNCYIHKSLILKVDKKVELDIYNGDLITQVEHSTYKVATYKLKENERFIIGEYKYFSNGYTYTTAIKKAIQPISWGVIGLGDQIIELMSKVSTYTPLEFENAVDPQLIFKFNFEHHYDIKDLTLDLIGPDRKSIRKFHHSVVNKEGLRVPLNNFLVEVINRSNSVDYHLRATLLDANDMLVTTFLLAKFQDELVVKNLKHVMDENEVDITFSWREEGPGFGRELILINCLKPWIDPYQFVIEDKKFTLQINSLALEEGVYRYTIQKESDDLFDESEELLTSLKELHSKKIIIEKDSNFKSELEEILYHLMRTRFLKEQPKAKNIRVIKNRIEKIELARDLIEVDQVTKSYIAYKRFFKGSNDAAEVESIFTSLLEKFVNDKDLVIKYILDQGFSNEYKKILLSKFYCLNATQVMELNDYQYKLLSDIDKNLTGFINLIKSDNNANGYRWAGISGIETLQIKDLSGDTEPTILVDENFGQIGQLQAFYMELLGTGKLSKKTTDLYREFHRNQPVKETIIFGKTRLQLLLEWTEANNGAGEIKRTLATILNIHCDPKIKVLFKEIFSKINKRSIDDETGYYIGLIALYASLCRHKMLEESLTFSRLLNYTIENCDKLYYRDALLIELYMKFERGLIWD